VQFRYTAKTMTGDTVSGALMADSRAQAQTQLREQGLFVIGWQANARRAAAEPAVRGRRRRVSRKDLLAFTSQFAVMAQAGIDVGTALSTLAQQCTNLTFRASLEKVHAEVMSGKSLSTALKLYPTLFGGSYVATVTAGEASGKLPLVLSRLAAMQRAELRFQTTRRTLLAYPTVLTVVATLVVLGLMFFVLPQFADVFAQFEMPLPVITQTLLAISAVLEAQWLLCIALALGALTAIMAIVRSEQGRYLRDYALLHGRYIRDVVRATLVGRAFRLLGIMLDSGVPLLEGLRLTRSSIGNRLFRSLFDQMEADVLNGRGLAPALSKVEFLPNGAAEMIMTGERTGTLAMVSQVMGEFYEEEGESRLRELATLVEPLIIIVMGVVVAFVVLSVMLPLFDFATIAQ
jgi:type II secretory pathway component PulF